MEPLNARDRIEREHADATHGERYDEDRPTRQELRDDAKQTQREERRAAEARMAALADGADF